MNIRSSSRAASETFTAGALACKGWQQFMAAGSTARGVQLLLERLYVRITRWLETMGATSLKNETYARLR